MTTQVAFGEVGALISSNLLPAMKYNSLLVSEEIVATALNQTTTIAATAARAVARVASTVAVYVSFGAAPNALTDTGRIMIPAGGVEYFVVASGDKGAVVEV